MVFVFRSLYVRSVFAGKVRCDGKMSMALNHYHHTTTILQPFFRDHPGELVPEENFWTL